MNEVLVRIQPTPNPNAWKFILDRPVLTEGKATYADSEEAKHARKIPGALGERMVDASDDDGITPHDSR